MIEPKSYKWFIEYTSPEEGHLHGIRMIHYASQTRFQRMEIMESGSYGRCLVLDGKMQSSIIDEFIYHEGLVHPAMLTHPNPKRVFIVGGGEGATLREVLRHKSVEYCMMVDIDREVVEKSKELLPEWHRGAFDDPRTDLRFMDARKYLEETQDSYDVIIIDISEPVEEGPAYLLFTREFYEIVKERLRGHLPSGRDHGAAPASELYGCGQDSERCVSCRRPLHGFHTVFRAAMGLYACFEKERSKEI
jgi:spermidine synthase